MSKLELKYIVKWNQREAEINFFFPVSVVSHYVQYIEMKLDGPEGGSGLSSALEAKF